MSNTAILDEETSLHLARASASFLPDERQGVEQRGETLTLDRSAWRGMVKRGVSTYEQEFIALDVDKRMRRKDRLASHTDPPQL